MLSSTSQSRPSLTRRMTLWLVVAGILAFTLPTFRVFSAATREGESQPSSAENNEAAARPEPAQSNVPAKRTVLKDKLRYDGKSFGEWKEVLATELHQERRKAALEALLVFGVNGYAEEAAPEIAEALWRSWSKPIADDAASGLARLGSAGLPALVRSLRHEDPTIRGSALGGLKSAYIRGEDKDRSVVIGTLVKATRDEHVSARVWACMALGDIARDGAHLQLGLGVPVIPDPPTPKPAYVRLVLPALISALKDKNKDVRSQAASALGDLGPHAAPAVPALIAATRDEAASVRSQACYAFGGILGVAPTPESVKPVVASLSRAMRDNQKRVRQSAAMALRAIGPNAAGAVPALIKAITDPLPEPLERTGENGFAGPRMFPVPGAFPVGGVFGRISQHTVGYAVRALGDIGPAAKAAIPVLRKMLDDDDPDSKAKVGAAEVKAALEKIQGKARFTTENPGKGASAP